MDKSKTITIKINGEEHSDPPQPDKQTEDQQPTFKVSAWNETAASKESADDAFDYILPDPVKQNDPPKVKKITKKKELPVKNFRLPAIKKIGRYNSVVPRVVLNIFLAVLVGLGFGLMILHTVTSDSSQRAGSPPAEQDAPSQPVAAGQSVELAPLSTFVVQGGVFSSRESAQTAAQSLAANGIAAEQFMLSDNQFALFVAIAGSLEAAKADAAALESMGVEVFAKPFELAGATVGGLGAEEAEIVKAADELLKLLSAGNTSNGEATAMVESIQAELMAVDEASLNHPQIISMKAQMEKAAAAFLANQEDQLQAETLAFLAAYHALSNS